MKRITTILLLFAATLNAFAAYNQQGIAYFYDYKTKKKTPLSGVSINVNGAQPAVSGAGGAFTLKFSSLGLGQKISFSKQPYYQGMKVFNKQVVDNWYIVQGRLVLVMCKYEEFELAKNNYYAQGKASVEKKFKGKIEALSKEVQRLRKENKDCAQQMQELQELNEEYERIMDDLRNSADAMARIDQSELDAEMQEILDLYEKGEVDEAMRKLNELNLKEKFEQTLSVKQRLEQEVAAAAQDSAMVLSQIRASIDLYKNNGDYCKAGEYLKLLADRLNTWDNYHIYAYFCQNQNNFREAETYYTKALNIIRPLAENNPQVYEQALSLILNNLGGLYYDTGRPTDSEYAYKQALEIRQRLAESNPQAYELSLAQILNNLGLLYKNVQSFNESEQAYKQALEIQKHHAGSSTQETISFLSLILNNLGSLYSDMRRFDDSEQAFKQALEIRKCLADSNAQAYEPDLAVTLNNMGFLYRKAKRFNESEQAFKQALEIHMRLADSNPQTYEPDLARTLNNLGALYSDMQHFSDSEQSFKQALEIRKRLAEFSPQAYEPDLAKTLNNLGSLYYSTQRYTDSEQVFKQALEIHTRLAEAHPWSYEPDLAVTLTNIGLLYVKQGKYDEAMQKVAQGKAIYQYYADLFPYIYKKALEDCEELLQLIQKLQEQSNNK